MHKLNKSLRHASLAVLSLIGFSSCQDWLTIYPQTQIVEENFWEDKNDLEGVRYATYKSMCESVEKMALWGDLRSDAYVLSTYDNSTSTQNFYNEVREGNIMRDSANAYFDWSKFYTTINYCNKVLSHGAQVLERDKQFTPSEWAQMKAEMTALRALNYFYLIRSFKDVPYTTKVINKDTEVEHFSASNQLDILDSLIIDVEAVKGQATNRYPNLSETKGTITNSAIYALLSDMYLWRASLHEGRFGRNATDIVEVTNKKGMEPVEHSVAGDYQKCIEYADLSIESLWQQNNANESGYGVSRSDMINFGLDKCDLYKNELDNLVSGPRLTAFQKIYVEGNSNESIFELQFNINDKRENSLVNSQWGYSQSSHLAVSSTAVEKALGQNMKYDARTWFTAYQRARNVNGMAQQTILPTYYCFKWCDVDLIDYSKGKIDEMWISTTTRKYNNWIVYRLSDVMLQKAEAYAALAKSNADANAKKALQIINALNRRWYCSDTDNPNKNPIQTSVDNADGESYYVATKPGTTGNLAQANSIQIAVMNERLIEFIGEGKRWFDLVRYAERNAGGVGSSAEFDVRESTDENPVNDGSVGVKKMIDDFMKGTYNSAQATALESRIRNRYGLYNIIYYMEIKASVDDKGVQHLEQNPVWNESNYDK